MKVMARGVSSIVFLAFPSRKSYLANLRSDACVLPASTRCLRQPSCSYSHLCSTSSLLRCPHLFFFFSNLIHRSDKVSTERHRGLGQRHHHIACIAAHACLSLVRIAADRRPAHGDGEERGKNHKKKKKTWSSSGCGCP
jgi:hypothetical protein